MSNENHSITLNGGTSAVSESSVPATEEVTQDTTVTKQGVTEASKGKEEPKVKGIHVVAAGDAWQVKESGKVTALFEHAVKKEAIKFATEHAKAVKAELFIHGQNGKIQSRNSYGNDPKGRG